jgi:hypothetical protein
MTKIDEIPVNEQVFGAVQDINAEALRDLNAEAQKHLEYLDQSLRGVISRSWVLVGWLVTLASSMVAVLVSQLWGGSMNVDVLIIASFSLASSLGIILFVVLKNFLFVSWFGPGEQPSVMLRKEVMARTTDLDKKETHRYLLACNLVERQRLIDFNQGVLRSIVKPYRVAVISTVSSLFVGVVLLGILALA